MISSSKSRIFDLYLECTTIVSFGSLRKSSPWKTIIAHPLSPGQSCCVTLRLRSVEALKRYIYSRPRWPQPTGRWDFGLHCAKSFRRHKNNAVVCTRLPMCFTSYLRASSHGLCRSYARIMRARDHKTATEETGRFTVEFENRYPKAGNNLVKNQEKLFTFFDYPDAHWLHLCSTNAIESTFATVEARTRTIK